MGPLFLVTVVFSIVVWFSFRRIRAEIPGGDEAALISEITSVTADFLEAGKVVELLSEGNYLGTISVRPKRRKHNQTGYVITMYDTGNLREAYEDYRKIHPEQNQTDFRVLEHFLETYGSCYDRERNGLVYLTKHSARTTETLEGEPSLRDQIMRHPLAQMEDLSRIHTKYVGERG